MDKKTVPLVILAIFLCAALVIGEVFTYGINTHSFDAKAEFSSGTLDYSVSSSGSDTYSVVLLDDNNVAPIKKLYIYVNEDYDRYYRSLGEDKTCYFEQQYFSEQIKKSLALRGFYDVTLLNTKELIDLIDDPASDPKGKGLFVSSYSLPSEIYSGNTTDSLMKWIYDGGSLYWSSSEIGKYYTDSNGLHEVANNQVLFFGKECVNTGKLEHATSVVDNGFKDALTLLNSGLRFTLNTDGIPDSLSIGYCEEGYSSISFVKHGNGMVCVVGAMFIGGQFEIIPLINDLSQIIASGTTYASEIIDLAKGNVVRGTVNGKMDYTVTGKAIAYIYIGGTYTVYGRCFNE